MKLINQYSNEAEAYIDKGYLESNGIECEVVSNAMSDIFPAPGSGNGSIDLYVADNQYKEAEKLLFHRENN
ncbi:MAG: DUF2007 domain-containing protein [Muribaculaceae bacterium]|nr:DUF2007 domain-containing protein [Muribaculaceae bacterium]